MARSEPRAVVDRLVLMLVLALCAGYIICIAFPYGWHKKSTPLFTFYVSLYSVEISTDGAGANAVKQTFFAHAGKKYVKLLEEQFSEGSQSIGSIKSSVCKLDAASGGDALDNCRTWSSLQAASYCGILGLMLTVACLMGCATLMNKPRTSDNRNKMMFLFFSAGVTACLTMGTYVCLSYKFSSWLTNIWGPKFTDSSSHHVLTYVACAFALLTLVPGVLFATCGSMFEDDDEEPDIEKKLMQAPMSAGPAMQPYGGMTSGGPPMMGQPPTMDPQMGYGQQGGYGPQAGYGDAPPAQW